MYGYQLVTPSTVYKTSKVPRLDSPSTDFLQKNPRNPSPSTMKLSPIILISFLPLLGLGNPIAEELSSVNLEPRGDKGCTLYPGVDNVNCREFISTYHLSKRMIRAGEKFGVACKLTDGEPVNGNRVWDYIPGWDCWVAARFTSNGCESKSQWKQPSSLQGFFDRRGNRWCAGVSSTLTQIFDFKPEFDNLSRNSTIS